MENRDNNSFGITNTFEVDDKSFEDSFFSEEAVTSNEEPAPIAEPKEEETSVENTTEDITLEGEPNTQEKFYDPLADEETPEDTTKESNEDTDEEDSEDNVISDFAKELFDAGVFTPIEDEDLEIKTPQDLRDRFIKEKQLGANEAIYNFLKDKHGQDGLDAFQAIYIKGVSPKEYFSSFEKVKSFRDLDIEGEDNIENQKNAYREFFKRQGISEEEIEKDLNREIQYGELEEKVKKYLPSLIKQEEKQLEDLEKHAEEEARKAEYFENQYKTKVASILSEKIKTKDFDGIPLTEKDANALFHYATEKKWELPSTGERLTDFDKWFLDLRKPENWEMRLKVALLAQSNLDISKIKTKAISEEKSDLFNSLTRKRKVSKRTENAFEEEFLKGL